MPNLTVQSLIVGGGLSGLRTAQLLLQHDHTVKILESRHRTAGLSGDAMSQIGPLGEIHDASSSNGYPYALFGFVRIPAAARQGRRDEMCGSAIEQLVRLFGTEASAPVSVHYKDWAEDKFTATSEDSNGPRGHVQQPPATTPLWNQSVFWAGSETSSVSAGHNGYLEGALAAAQSVFAQVLE